MKKIWVIMLLLILISCWNNNQIKTQEELNNVSSIISFYKKNNKDIFKQINSNKDFNTKNELFYFLKECESLIEWEDIYENDFDFIEMSTLLEFVNEILNNDIWNFNKEYFTSLWIDEEEFENAQLSRLIYFLYKNNILTKEKANELFKKGLSLLKEKNALQDTEIFLLPFYSDLINNNTKSCDLYLLNEEEKINTMLIFEENAWILK